MRYIFFLLVVMIGPGVMKAQGQDAQEWVKKGAWAHGLQLMPHAATNMETFREQYQRNPAYWDSAFAFMKRNDLLHLPNGKYPIDSIYVYASVTNDPSKDFDKTNWESHKKYIDLQYIISGDEIIGVCPVSQAVVTRPYDEKKDVANYTAEGKMEHSVPGTFFLFFPSDAHRPNITPGGNKPVKKLVIKIRYSE